MMWLELNGEKIVGIHSHPMQSLFTWAEYSGNDANIGDRFLDGGLIKPSFDSDTLDNRRRLAGRLISDEYPVWLQLNILRINDTDKLETMNNYIDGVRRWSNDLNQPFDDIDNFSTAASGGDPKNPLDEPDIDI